MSAPLPERLRVIGPGGTAGWGTCLIADGGSRIYARMTGRDKALRDAMSAEIARRWNAHAALVAACEGLLCHVEADHCRMTDGEPDDDTRDEVNAARAALRAAKEEPRV